MNAETATATETPTNGRQPAADLPDDPAVTAACMAADAIAPISPLNPMDSTGWYDLIDKPLAPLLAAIRPPMTAREEIEASKKLMASFAKAQGEIGTCPHDSKVEYRSTRTNETVKYSFASIASIRQIVTEPLVRHGLSLTCVQNDKLIAVIVMHEDGGMLPNWMPLHELRDLKEYAAQITMKRRYLTVQLLAIASEEERGEQGVPEDMGTRSRQRRKAEPAADKGPEQRIDATLRRLPAETAAALRRRHPQGGQALLDAAMHELHRREQTAAQAAKTDKQQPAPPNGAAGGAKDTKDGTRGTAEDRIVSGFRALKLSPGEQQALRAEYAGRDQELVDHLSEIYRARQLNQTRQ